MNDIHEQARNKWASLLAMLGVPAELLQNRHGACPLCGGRDRFRFDDKDGKGTWFCNQCGAGNGMDLALKFTNEPFKDLTKRLRAGLGEATERKPKPEIDPKHARQLCRALWQGGTPLFDDQATAYLKARGLTGPFPSELRFHHGAEVSDHPLTRKLPAMLARVSDANGNGVNIHRTYLDGAAKARWTPKGATVEAASRRLMPGGLPAGSCIRLGEHGGELGVAEGIETALAVTQLFGVPCWSLINSTNMAKWIVPDDVRKLIVFGDHDPKYGGQAAAYTLAHKAAVRPTAIDVEVRLPDSVGTDFADLLGGSNER